MTISRWFTVGFGIIQIGIATQAKHLDETVVNNALKIAGFSAGLLLGIFALGVFSRRAGQASALIGAGAGLALLCYVQFIGPGHGLTIAWPWLALIGSVTTFGCGELVAFFVPKETRSSKQS